MRIDLHVHSNRSDGSDSPAQLVKLAGEKEIAAFALTDHDTVDGVREALEASERSGVTVIPGIELSCEYNGQDIHILGLNMDINCTAFLERLEAFRREREARNKKMLQKMENMGLPVHEKDLYTRYPGAVITRAHFAEYLMEQGAVSTVQEAFERYIGTGKPCYLPKKRISCKEAISAVHCAKGHPVLAHPMQYKLPQPKLEALLTELIGYGLEGLEAVYSTHTEAQERYLRELAKRYRLHISGGSDYHGTKKPDISMGTGRGSLYVHHEIMDWIR